MLKKKEIIGKTLYVSDKGEVFSEKQQLKATKDRKGYLRIKISKNGKHTTLKVHRLVAELFIGNIDDMQINHKDGNKENNNVENLEVVSCKENIQHAISTGLRDSYAKGLRDYNEKRKTKVIAINVKTEEIIEFSTVSEAEKALNTKHVSAVINGKRLTAAGYTFVRG